MENSILVLLDFVFLACKYIDLLAHWNRLLKVLVRLNLTKVT